MDETSNNLLEKMLGASESCLDSIIQHLKDNNDDVVFYTACLLARSISNTRAIRVLLNAGQVLEALVIVRCLIENSLWSVGLAKEGQDFLRRAIGDIVHSKKQMGKDLYSWYVKEGLINNADELDAKLRELDSVSTAAGRIDFASLAAQNDLAGAYIFFRDLSRVAAHPSLDSLLGHNEGSPSNAPVNISFSFSELPGAIGVLLMSLLCILLAAQKVVPSSMDQALIAELAKKHSAYLKTIAD